jgi:hypothetical protein
MGAFAALEAERLAPVDGQERGNRRVRHRNCG